MTPWLQFGLSALVITLAAVKLAQYGDAVAYRTGLGRMFIGSLLLAGATSLPELLTMISSIRQDHLNITAGDLFGSSMLNMMLLGVLDMLFYRQRVLRRIALKHALTASLGTLLTGMAVFFLLAKVDVRLAWIGIDSVLMLGIYVVGVWLLRASPALGHEEGPGEGVGSMPSLRRALVGFGITGAVLVAAAPWMVQGASGIALLTGAGDSFVGIVLVALVTSLPELVAMVAAARVGAYDMAAGNLFGSNVFNMAALALADFVYLGGSFWSQIDPLFALVGLMAMLLTTLGLIGNLAQVERRVWLVELDAIILIMAYFAGLYLLYTRGAALG
jgi:cation:H+ antiporter